MSFYQDSLSQQLAEGWTQPFFSFLISIHLLKFRRSLWEVYRLFLVLIFVTTRMRRSE